MATYFDLNIDTILEHWSVAHALRELIANAIDETILTKAADFQISKESGTCTIRDYGRGLQYKHFVQNESTEKLENKLVIQYFKKS